MTHFARTHPNGVWEDVPAPTISLIAPATGGFSTTNVFTITGTNLQYATAVEQFFNAGGAPGNDFASWVVDSPTQFTVTTSSLNPALLMDIKVTTDTGNVTAFGSYTYV